MTSEDRRGIHDDPLWVLSEALGVPRRPRPLWWILQLGIWTAPAAVLIVIALVLPDPSRAVVLTIMGAFVGVQLAAPYRVVSRTIMKHVKAHQESRLPVRYAVLSTLKFYGWEAGSLFLGGHRLGHAPIALPFERARYRHRYRQCRRYFIWLDIRLAIPGEPPSSAAYVRRCPRWIPPAVWRWRQRRVLGLLSRDLIRATSDWSSAEIVDTVARANKITYTTARPLRRNLQWSSRHPAGRR